MMVFAPTGAGKSRGVVIPNLLHWRGPAVVIDVKGELCNTTALYRRDVLGQDVHVIDPWSQTTFPKARLNPLDVFKVEGVEPVDQAFMLANMFRGGGKFLSDPFWEERAETLIAGLLLMANGMGEKGTLGWVSDILTSSNPIQGLTTQAAMLAGSNEGRRCVESAIETAENTRLGILSTAQSLLRPLISKSVKEACGPSTISLDAVRRGDPTTIYIVVPPSRIASQSAILKVWLTALVSAMTERRTRPETETLIVLDEVAQLGRMEQVRTLLTLGRGYGCRAMLVFQSYAQLELLYSDHLTLMENAAAVLTFGHNARSMSRALADQFGDVSADALFAMGREEIAVKLGGRDTRIAKRLDYITDALFAGRYCPNPMFDRPSPSIGSGA